MTAVQRWREQLERWAIPPEILASAPESPWGFPTELFRARGARGADREHTTPTTARALEALPEAGRVLDVGCGGGATSLPLADRAGPLVGVDAQEDMLDGFLANAHAAGVSAVAVLGRWPEVADTVDAVDVAVAGHVLYNVADLEPFALRLAALAVHRVVFELTDRHPLAWMNDLWLHFHGLERPTGPSSHDALDAFGEIGLDAMLERWGAPPPVGGFAERADALALARRRLCLPSSRDDELASALGPRLAERGGLWSVGPLASQRLATIWFDP
ncbi:MAG TPA: methyltransferase domain-containing protein [Actinomycetota bacterium]|nr:methyltransferase domain-containing protein [Actinomycetota bacterium]